MNNPCNVCRKVPATLIQVSMYEALCRKCFNKRKAFIRKLPKVKDQPAPLGHHFIGRSYFANDFTGASFCNKYFEYIQVGSVH